MSSVHGQFRDELTGDKVEVPLHRIYDWNKFKDD